MSHARAAAVVGGVWGRQPPPVARLHLLQHFAQLPAEDFELISSVPSRPQERTSTGSWGWAIAPR